MINKMIMITNNSLCCEKFKNNEKVKEIIFIKGSLMDVLKKARDEIHKGHALLTHPLMSSVKPNETPYRTVCIALEKNPKLDLKSLYIIEDSIAVVEKLSKNSFKPVWNENVLEDFKYIDYDIMNNTLN